MGHDATDKAHNHLIVVTGQPRSGTSLTLRILHASGIPTFADELTTFETNRTADLKAENDWIMALTPGTALKVLYPQCLHLPIDCGYKMIWCSRNPKTQAKSQRRFLKARGKTVPPRESLAIRARQIRRVEREIPKELSRLGAGVFRLWFEKLVRLDQGTLDDLCEFLGEDLDFSPVVRRTPTVGKFGVGQLEVA